MGPLHDRRRAPSRRTFLMLGIEVLVLGLAIWRLSSALLPASPAEHGALPLATLPERLTRRDVLPTLTPDVSRPLRMIVFPAASMSAPIVGAGRVKGSWETRHLGDSVGHLAGTGWLGDPGANIVLAGHVESATGAPGPFKHLFEAHVGDLVLLRDGDREAYYEVVAVEEAAPDEVRYVAQDGHPRLTMITCTGWDPDERVYHGRLIVVAEPAGGHAHR